MGCLLCACPILFFCRYFFVLCFDDLLPTYPPDYNISTMSCNSGKVCGDYTQEVWHDSYALGCGYKLCTTGSPFAVMTTWLLLFCCSTILLYIDCLKFAHQQLLSSEEEGGAFFFSAYHFLFASLRYQGLLRVPIRASWQLGRPTSLHACSVWRHNNDVDRSQFPKLPL